MRTLFVLTVSMLHVGSMAVSEQMRFKDKSLDVVRRAAENYDPGAIEELGVRKDKSSIDLLKRIASESESVEMPAKDRPSWSESKVAIRVRWKNESRIAARIALAKHGEGAYFGEFVRDLSSPDPVRRARSIRYLGLIGRKSAVKHLAPILEDNRVPPQNNSHVKSGSYAMMAADSLRLIMPDVESHFLANSKGRGYVPIQEWKNWWDKNKKDFDEIE